MKDYAIVYEKTATGWSAYAPDLPGLGVAGETFEEAESLMHDGIVFHIEALQQEGTPVPEPTVRVATLSVAA